MSYRHFCLIGFTVLCVAAACLLPAMPQPVAYHDFADQRTMFGVPNFFNVASNFGFLIAAVAGSRQAAATHSTVNPIRQK